MPLLLPVRNHEYMQHHLVFFVPRADHEYDSTFDRLSLQTQKIMPMFPMQSYFVETPGCFVLGTVSQQPVLMNMIKIV